MKGIDTALQLFEFKVEESARADGKEKSRLINASRQGLEHLVREPNLKSYRATLGDVSYEIIAGGRLVQLLTALGVDALTFESPEFDIPVYFAKIKGEWLIAR